MRRALETRAVRRAYVGPTCRVAAVSYLVERRLPVVLLRPRTTASIAVAGSLADAIADGSPLKQRKSRVPKMAARVAFRALSSIFREIS